MSGSKLSSDLIRSIKVRAMIPENQVTFSDEDFLRFATEELQNSMFGEILRHHEDFFLYQEAVPMVANKTRYRIPGRAGGVRLRDVQIQDSGGNRYEMTRIDVQDAVYYNNSSAGNLSFAFYIQNNEVVLQPEIRGTIPAGADLIFYFYGRPNDLVLENRGAVVSNINFTTGDVVLESTPTNAQNESLFGTSTKLDIISKDSPHITEKFSISPIAVNLQANTLTFTPSDLPENMQVGDYVNLTGEAFVPQIPAEQHMQLAMRVAMRCLTSLGDLQGYQNIKDELEEVKRNTTAIIDNRVEGAPRKVVNRHSIMRDGLFRRRFRFRS